MPFYSRSRLLAMLYYLYQTSYLATYIYIGLNETVLFRTVVG